MTWKSLPQGFYALCFWQTWTFVGILVVCNILSLYLLSLVLAWMERGGTLKVAGRRWQPELRTVMAGVLVVFGIPITIAVGFLYPLALGAKEIAPASFLLSNWWRLALACFAGGLLNCIMAMMPAWVGAFVSKKAPALGFLISRLPDWEAMWVPGLEVCIVGVCVLIFMAGKGVELVYGPSAIDIYHLPSVGAYIVYVIALMLLAGTCRLVFVVPVYFIWGGREKMEGFFLSYWALVKMLTAAVVLFMYGAYISLSLGGLAGV